MFIVKWVEMDDVFSYYPQCKVVKTYEEARVIKSDMEEILESQYEQNGDIFSGKIISEIYIYEITEM
ncbi:MAG: hypothetical protein KIT33_10295 [Candidatus Kapabacteria bacterium]|nr:hypothetical protein [Ignavibacteriota bacterium]MCW5885348.1 hypothetical protein [Candidatus Kapabacteria bacterium]